MKYLKLTTANNNHNGLIFKENELITDPIHMTQDECKPGGIYFTDTENWARWVKYGNKIMYWIWDCKPVGEIITFEGKYKAQSVILTNPRCIWKDPEIQLAAIQYYGLGIRFIENPSEAVQLAAVKQDVCSIKYIENPTEPVQLAAVKQDCYCIMFIKNPSEAARKEANKSDCNIS
jgi:hypothetical protein